MGEQLCWWATQSSHWICSCFSLSSENSWLDWQMERTTWRGDQIPGTSLNQSCLKSMKITVLIFSCWCGNHLATNWNLFWVGTNPSSKILNHLKFTQVQTSRFALLAYQTYLLSLKQERGLLTPINFFRNELYQLETFPNSFAFFVGLLGFVVSLETLAMQAGMYKSQVLMSNKTVILTCSSLKHALQMLIRVSHWGTL